MNIIFEFVGGPLDGQTVVGQAGDQDEADRYYALTHHGRVGQQFRVASDYAVEMLAQEQLKEERPHQFQQHRYEVTDRVEADYEVLVRVRYVEKNDQRGQKVSIREHLEASRPSAESPPQMIDRFLRQTARSMGDAYSHCWPRGSAESGHTAGCHVLVHLAHVLLSENFLVMTHTSHPTDRSRDVDLVGIAASQDWFLACCLGDLSDVEGVGRLAEGVEHLRCYWLSERMTIEPCGRHVRRLADHCRQGYALVAGIHWVDPNGQDAPRLDFWRSRGGIGNTFQLLFERLTSVNAFWMEPAQVQRFEPGGTYHLLGAFFPIPRHA